jgi:hypothetical protein
MEARFDIYLFNKLQADAAEVLKAKPVASVASAADGKATVDFEPRGTPLCRSTMNSKNQ